MHACGKVEHALTGSEIHAVACNVCASSPVAVSSCSYAQTLLLGSVTSLQDELCRLESDGRVIDEVTHFCETCLQVRSRACACMRA